MECVIAHSSLLIRYRTRISKHQDIVATIIDTRTADFTVWIRIELVARLLLTSHLCVSLRTYIDLYLDSYSGFLLFFVECII